LAPDAQAARVEAVLAGQGVQASGQEVPGLPPVQVRGGRDRFAATVPGPVEPGLGAPDPEPLRPGQPAGLVERYAPGNGDPDAAGGPDGDGNAPGPPSSDEDDGPDAVELENERPALNPRNRTFSGPACC
jgi:hypothetical protein